MPRKPKAQPVELPAIPAELLEQFGNGPMTAEAINAATLALKKALIERALGGAPASCASEVIAYMESKTGDDVILNEFRHAHAEFSTLS